jgi:hypothetical protein
MCSVKIRAEKRGSNLAHLITKGDIQMKRLKLMKNGLSLLFRGVPVTLAVMGMLFAAAIARAGCGDQASRKGGVAARVPFLAHLGGGIEQSNAEAVQDPEYGTDARDNKDSIVGLWHVIYTADGQTLYESFDQWHSDGTELENPNLPPATGPLCVGVWKQVGLRTFRLHHVGWNFDINGNSLGTFTLDESNTVDPHGRTYQGSFDLKFYDVNGNLVQEVTGTQTATRITVS